MSGIDHTRLEGLAQEYATALGNRKLTQGVIRHKIGLLAAELTPLLRQALAAERDARDALMSAVEQAPGLFERPKTRTVHGIQYGWRTGKGSIEFTVDEATTIRRIRNHLPEDQQELLLRVKVSVHKPAAVDLTVQDLRRLGMYQSPPEDRPLVKAAEDGTDKLVDVLLAECAEDADG